MKATDASAKDRVTPAAARPAGGPPCPESSATALPEAGRSPAESTIARPLADASSGPIPIDRSRAPGPPGLDDAVTALRGVGERRAGLLGRLGVRTLRDLADFIPRTYSERPRRVPIADLEPGTRATVVAEVASAAIRRRRDGRRDLVARVRDGTGQLEVIWFQQPYLLSKLRPGTHLALWGEVMRRRGLQLCSPEFETLGEPGGTSRNADEIGDWAHAKLLPIYRLTEGLGQKQVRRLVSQALAVAVPQMDETLAPTERTRLRLPPRSEALRMLHAPASSEDVARGRERLIFDEFLHLLLALGRWRNELAAARSGHAMRAGMGHRRALRALPFELTRAQRRGLATILADMAAPRVMHRLLEGDVGCGKTVVALLAATAAADAGRQTALMVPTEILAYQHRRNVERLFPELRAATLTGAASAGERRQVLGRLADAQLDLVIGTQALFAGDVRFGCLGLVIIDEQHRFGVAQRAALHAKGESPDMLVMTATPIPRSLALTCFGDLDLTPIDEHPPGRQPPRTFLAEPEHRDRVLDYLDRRIAEGAQVVMIAPRIDATGASDLLSAQECLARLRRHALLGRRRLSLLHGRLPLGEKQRVVDELHGGQIDLLVATTVVEVGLDVSRLQVMVIEHPERFGLSQLHQLRGRVGRGTERGECILQIDFQTPPEARRRLEGFAHTHDGFRVAALDLETRGVGELIGFRQHGFDGLRVADLVRDRELLESARRVARRLLAQDPQLERQPVLRDEVDRAWSRGDGSASCSLTVGPLTG